MSLEVQEARYRAAMHAVQSGVAAKMQLPSGGSEEGETSPKHLRVGVNSSMVSVSALARLLISKDLITLEEYWAMMATVAEEEKANYEAFLSMYHHTTITLG